MVSRTKEFPQRDAERVAQLTSYGANWMREIAEQHLNQSKAALDTLLNVTKQAVSGMDQQSSAVCKSSMQTAEQALSNSFDFAHKLIRAKDVQEVAQAQADFVSRQTDLIGGQTKQLAQDMMQGMNEAANAAAEPLRTRSEAA